MGQKRGRTAHTEAALERAYGRVGGGFPWRAVQHQVDSELDGVFKCVLVRDRNCGNSVVTGCLMAGWNEAWDTIIAIIVDEHLGNNWYLCRNEYAVVRRDGSGIEPRTSDLSCVHVLLKPNLV